MNWEELQEKLQELAEEAIEGTTIHGAKEANLDRRACAQVYRGPDFLAISMTDLGSMRYYGGFEYVLHAHTMEVGGYVFYSTDCARVDGHWQQLEPEVEPEWCSACNGSGEGQYDGTRCSYCGGKGATKQTGE